MNNWKHKVDFFLKQNNIKFYKKSLLVAVSGGSDSMLLLNYCIFLLEKSVLNKVGVVHVNHCLREDAQRDENFVKAICESHLLDFYSIKIDIQKKSKLEKTSVEEAGRNARYDFFNEILETYRYDFVLTAHHKNDLAESFIINSIKGAGLKGLAGINVVDKKIVRPFLCLDKKEILKAIKIEGVKFVEDHTNNQNDYLRNYVRNVVLKSIEEIEPSAVDNISKSSSIAGNLNSYLNCYSRLEIEKDFWGNEYIPIENISFNPSVIYYQLKEAFLEWGLNSTRSSLWSTIAEMLKNGNRGVVDLDSGVKVRLDCDGIRKFYKYDNFDPINLNFENKNYFFEVFNKKIEYRLSFCNNNNYFLVLKCLELGCKEKIKLEKSKFPYVITPRNDGDRDVLGKKLKEVFVKLAIPGIYKDSWPLIADKNGKIENIIFYQRWKNYGS